MLEFELQVVNCHAVLVFMKEAKEKLIETLLPTALEYATKSTSKDYMHEQIAKNTSVF